jgi:hypothetical protein
MVIHVCAIYGYFYINNSKIEWMKNRVCIPERQSYLQPSPLKNTCPCPVYSPKNKVENMLQHMGKNVKAKNVDYMYR